MTGIELAKDLTYEERPFRILDEMERVTRSKVKKFYKVHCGMYGMTTQIKLLSRFDNAFI